MHFKITPKLNINIYLAFCARTELPKYCLQPSICFYFIPYKTNMHIDRCLYVYVPIFVSNKWQLFKNLKIHDRFINAIKQCIFRGKEYGQFVVQMYLLSPLFFFSLFGGVFPLPGSSPECILSLHWLTYKLKKNNMKKKHFSSLINNKRFIKRNDIQSIMW